MTQGVSSAGSRKRTLERAYRVNPEWERHTQTRRKWFVAVASSAALLLAVACGGDDEEERPASPYVIVDPAAAVRITSPEDGATLNAGEIEVAIEAFGLDFRVVDKIGQPAQRGERHVHYYLDVDEIPVTPGQPAITADETAYHAETTTSYTWKDVGPGEHVFGVQLVNNDHTPLEPPVADDIDVTVE